MPIIQFDPGADDLRAQMAAALVEAFRVHSPEAWPDQTAGLAEVAEFADQARICRVAVTEAGEVQGWIGGISQYDGHVWELHPLVVRPAFQRQGVGRRLVQDFEAQVRARGGLTILLGTDDEDNRTSLAGVDLYAETWRQIAAIRNLGGHPFEFYQKLGYTLVGVVPDANGWGRPDLLMAKRVGAAERDARS